MVGWVGRLAGGWLGGWVGGGRFVRGSSVFVPVGGGAVTAFGTTAVFCSLRCLNRPALAKFEYETTHPYAAVLL